MKVKKCAVTILLVFFLSFGAFVPKAHAGIPVIDFASIIQAVMSFITELESVANTYTSIENQVTSITNQVKSLEMQAKNLQNMNLANAFKNLTALRGTFGRVKNLVNSTNAIPFKYNDIQVNYDRLYKRVDKSVNYFSGMSIKELKDSSTDVMSQTSEAVRDAMLSHGMISDIEEDEGSLETLLTNSDAASGELEVSQVNNQLVALNTNQLIRLQSMMAASSRLQASKDAEQIQNKLMSQAETERFNKPTSTNDPLQGSGAGPGFMDFK